MSKSSIGNKIYFRQIVGTGLRQLPGDLGGDTAAAWTELIGVVLVHLQDHANRFRTAKSVSEGGEIEIVAGRIPHQAEPGLDAGDLGQGRYPQGAFPDRYLFDFQRQSADEIPNSGFHTVETSEDQHGPLDSRGDPTLGCLEICQNVVEAIAQVPDDVVVVERYPMSGVVYRCGTTDQNGVGHQLLQPGRGGEYILHSPGLHSNSDYNH